ncbi:MAG TPA: cache domain-containing protein, partial [Bacilli bacterium]
MQFPAFRNMKFSHKLFLSYLVASILPILILGVYSYSQIKSYSTEKTLQGLNGTATEMASNLNYKIEKYNNLINYIVFNTKIQQAFSNNYQDLQALITDMGDYIYPFFSSITQMNDDIKQITVYSKTDMPEYNNWIRSFEHIENADWIVDAEKSVTTKWMYTDELLFAARKLKNIYTDEDLGMLYLNVDYNVIFNSEGNAIMEDMGMVVVDKTGNPIFRSPDKQEGKEILPLELLGTIQDGMVNDKGKSWLIMKKAIPSPDWTLYYYIPMTSVTSKSGQILRTTIAIILVCFILVMALISLLSRTIVRRIVFLNRKINLVEEGKLDLVITSESND